MKTLVTIIFNASETPWDTLRRLLIDCNLSNLAERGPNPIDVYAVELEDGSDQLECLTASLHSAHLSWSLNRQNVYSAEELAWARLLRIIVDREPKGLGGPTYGTEYDLSFACPACGSGARQVSPLVLDASDLPRSGPIFQTLRGEVLVSRRLRDSIEAMQPRGLELREAISKTSRQGLGFFQLLAEHELPPMDKLTKGLLREGECPACQRDGHFESLEEPLTIRYRAADFRPDDIDAYFSYEWFGNSMLRAPFLESVLAHPLVIISARLYSTFVDSRVPRVRFEPVEVVAAGVMS